MESLPEEMVEAVAVNLTLEDLAACCLVSRGWREAFNKDIVWRRYSCEQTTAEHIRGTASVVEPHFQLPEQTETNLSPMCEQRVNLLLEKRLWNNWRQGKFKKSTILNAAFVADKIYFLTNDHIVFLLKNKITVWNVHDDSKNGFFEPVRLPSDSVIDLCKITNNDKVVVIQQCVVYIFFWDLNSTQWYFQYAFAFNDSSNALFKSLGAIKFPEEQGKSYLYNIFGNIFFGWLSDQAIIHIWDIEKCRKLKEQVLPTTKCINIKGFHQSETRRRYIMISTIEKAEEYQFPLTSPLICYVYDLVKFFLLPHQVTMRFCTSYDEKAFSLCCDGIYFIHGRYISVVYRNILYICNVESGQTFPFIVGPIRGIPQVFNDNLVFYSSGRIKVYNPFKNTLTTIIDEVSIPRSLLNIGNKFCVAYHKKSNSLFCEVWELSKNLEAIEAKTKLFYWNPGAMLSNKAGTILLAVSESEGRLCKLCFW